MLILSNQIVVFIFIIWERLKLEIMTTILKWKKIQIEKHFDFRLNGSTDVNNNSSHQSDSEYGYALLRDEIKAQEGCNPDILIEQDGKDQNPHLTKFKDANDKYLG